MKVEIIFDSNDAAHDFAVVLRLLTENPSNLNLAAFQSTLPHIVTVEEEKSN